MMMSRRKISIVFILLFSVLGCESKMSEKEAEDELIDALNVTESNLTTHMDSVFIIEEYLATEFEGFTLVAISDEQYTEIHGALKLPERYKFNRLLGQIGFQNAKLVPEYNDILFIHEKAYRYKNRQAYAILDVSVCKPNSKVCDVIYESGKDAANVISPKKRVLENGWQLVAFYGETKN